MADEPIIEALGELATDGAWTARQLASRRDAWALPDLRGYVERIRVRLHPTAWAHRTVAVSVVRPNARGLALLRRHGIGAQEIRPQELEHALGVAELRFRCGARRSAYVSQDGLGREHRRLRGRGAAPLADHIADGAIECAGGLVLLEYDHGRYTARQVREKIASQRAWRSGPHQRLIGTIWGAPTPRRAAWLTERGVGHVVVLRPEAWMG